MNKEEIIQEVYDLNLQNNTEKTDFDRSFKFGIETAFEEMEERGLLILSGVSNTFKAKIKDEIISLKTALKKISKNVEMSFTEPEKWKKEMHLINGKIEGLELALNCC